MVPIRKGDGTGLAAKGYSQVRKGDGTVLWNAIPDVGDLQQRSDARALSLSDGETVDPFSDQTENENDLAAVGNPTFNETTDLDLPAVTYDTSDGHQSDFSESVQPPLSWFGLIRRRSVQSDSSIPLLDNSSGDFLQLQEDRITADWLAFTDDGNVSTDQFVDTDWHIVGIIWSDPIRLRIDGQELDIDENTTIAILNGLSIGVNRDQDSGKDMEVVESLTYDGDKNDVADDIEVYLNRDSDILSD